MLDELMFILSWISPLALLSGIVGGLVYWRKLIRLEWMIVIFFSIFLVIDLYSRWIIRWLDEGSNLWVLSFYVFFEYVFISLTYVLFLPTSQSKQLKVFSTIGVLLIIIVSLASQYSISPALFQMYEGLLGHFFILLMGLFFMYQMLTDKIEPSQQQRNLNAVIVMFSSIHFFMALTINFMVNMDVEVVFFFWLVRLIVLTVFYLKFSQIIWKAGKRVIR